jgi:hypothetical protein
MSFIELIGFVITMISLSMLSYQSSKEKQEQREDPEEYSPEMLKQDPAVQELLRSMNIKIPQKRASPKRPKKYVQEEEDDYSPLPPTPVEPPIVFKPSKSLTTGDKAYKLERQHSYIKNDLLKRVSLKDVMILNVIFGKPKGQ